MKNLSILLVTFIGSGLLICVAGFMVMLRLPAKLTLPVIAGANNLLERAKTAAIAIFIGDKLP